MGTIVPTRRADQPAVPHTTPSRFPYRQEERKVEVLTAKLAELGVDATPLLAAASADESDLT